MSTIRCHAEEGVFSFESSEGIFVKDMVSANADILHWSIQCSTIMMSCVYNMHARVSCYVLSG